MAFHIEISHGVTHARVFNFGPDRLRAEVLDPWMQGRPVALGDKQWIPADCELKILEGPELGPNDLNFGRGWDSAEHTARDVTVAVLRDFAPSARSAGEVGVLAETPWGAKAVADALEQIGVAAADWADLRATALAGGGGAPIAILAVESAEPVGWWLFESGLAIGALGRRAVVVGLGKDVPEPLRALGVVQLDPQDPDSIPALAQRLQTAGLKLPTKTG